jgi:predicted small lipoprotein YifL
MSEVSIRLSTLACLLAMLAGCGQKGPLYLPDRGGEVVTRPTQTSSPGTVDSPQGPANPAPEVTKPEEDPEKKQDGGSPPPP